MKLKRLSDRSGWIFWSLLVTPLALASSRAAALPFVTPTVTRDQAIVRKPRLPLSFVANQGQLGPDVRFHLQRDDQAVWIGSGEITLWALAKDGPPAKVEIQFVDALPTVQVVGKEPLPGVANFYQGDDPSRWVTGAPTYAAVVQRELYPGIAHVYRGTENRLKSEFRVAPGADPKMIRMAYTGVDELRIDGNGDLVVRTPVGEWRESAPIVYQEIGSRRFEVSSTFQMLNQDQVGFSLGAYDPDHELVIDPTLHFSTYLGGAVDDLGADIAVDGDGNVLVVGGTTSLNFPLENEESAASMGNADIFVAKFSPLGDHIVYSTYIGGTAREFGIGIDVDPGGNAYCVGWTTSTDFPIRGTVFGPQPFGVGGNVDDAVVFKLGPTGMLVYSTYVGGSGDDQAEDISVDDDGFAFVVGNTSSLDFPTTSPVHSTSNQGVWDLFAFKLFPDGSTLVYSTYIGGSDYDEPMALAVDAEGSA